ncbi:MAG: hypothetical protein BWY64_00679 [bacterium ADurb.Bin363]|nr:MAG: hypothetical protein BWY64_00679 [bacterium ADurb.Bin363]
MTKKKTIAPKQIKLLWGLAGSRCAICKVELIKEKNDGEKFPIGVMAHIQGENSNSARYNHNMTDEERSSYKNLLLLCPTDHTIIDNNIQDYTVEKLEKIKKDHEIWVAKSLKNCIPDITFAELELILKYLITTPVSETPGNIIPPQEKIKKNNLSVATDNLITMGLSQSLLVKDYLNKHPDIYFNERLKGGFIKKYDDLRKIPLEGDSLFYGLLEFASNSSSDFKIQAAGLTVLVYFFELCEVFEK